MDTKDLRTESTLACINDGSTTFNQDSSTLHSNKLYQDIGSNSLGKVEAQTIRPCAIIGPDRVLPPPTTSDVYLKKAPVEPWPCNDNIYRQSDIGHKLPEYEPSRNISPRQTFQENMPRIMVPSHNPLKDNANLKTSKPDVSSEVKYCDVPYTINPVMNSHQSIRTSELPNASANLWRNNPPYAWNGSVASRPRPYGPEFYQYSDYVRPRPMLRPHHSIQDDPAQPNSDHHYQEANVRYKPYSKERCPPTRYNYVNNFHNAFPPSTPFPPHNMKYDSVQKGIPHTYMYQQIPVRRMPDPNIDSYQRCNQQNYNLYNQYIPPQYGPVPGTCIQNKLYNYPPEIASKPPIQNKLPYDVNSKPYFEYDGSKRQMYLPLDNVYCNDPNRPPVVKSDMPLPVHPGVNIHHHLPHNQHRKDIFMKNFDNIPNYRVIDPTYHLNNSLPRHPLQYSPSAIAMSPVDSNEALQSLGMLQEDCGYISQSSTASGRSIDSGNYRLQPDHYKRLEYMYNSSVKHYTHHVTAEHVNTKKSDPDKKSLDVRQFLQMWNESEDEVIENISIPPNTNNSSNSETISNQEQLYVLGLVNIPNEELPKYEHIQKISKLPENIKGYNSIELLDQYEQLVESPAVRHSNKTINNHPFSPKNLIKQSVSIPRPLSPLDVEAKISQSVIHKDVGCNFEIKPCSPKMLNVEVATPVQNIFDERAIEKVINLGITNSPMLTDQIQNKPYTNANSPKAATSCKMNSPYLSNNDLIKTNNYTLTDLESNSGVCLASLPRLDSDIELNFPEINQQFIDANINNSVNKPDLSNGNRQCLNYSLNNDNMTSDTKILTTVSSEKEMVKLSKFRKLKTTEPILKEIEPSIAINRTDSVIIKNPENIKPHSELFSEKMIRDDSLETFDSPNFDVQNPPHFICEVDKEETVSYSVNKAIDYRLPKPRETLDKVNLNSPVNNTIMNSDEDKIMMFDNNYLESQSCNLLVSAVKQKNTENSILDIDGTKNHGLEKNYVVSDCTDKQSLQNEELDEGSSKMSVNLNCDTDELFNNSKIETLHADSLHSTEKITNVLSEALTEKNNDLANNVNNEEKKCNADLTENSDDKIVMQREYNTCMTKEESSLKELNNTNTNDNVSAESMKNNKNVDTEINTSNSISIDNKQSHLIKPDDCNKIHDLSIGKPQHENLIIESISNLKTKNLSSVDTLMDDISTKEKEVEEIRNNINLNEKCDDINLNVNNSLVHNLYTNETNLIVTSNDKSEYQIENNIIDNVSVENTLTVRSNDPAKNETIKKTVDRISQPNTAESQYRSEYGGRDVEEKIITDSLKNISMLDTMKPDESVQLHMVSNLSEIDEQSEDNNLKITEVNFKEVHCELNDEIRFEYNIELKQTMENKSQEKSFYSENVEEKAISCSDIDNLINKNNETLDNSTQPSANKNNSEEINEISMINKIPAIYSSRQVHYNITLKKLAYEAVIISNKYINEFLDHEREHSARNISHTASKQYLESIGNLNEDNYLIVNDSQSKANQIKLSIEKILHMKNQDSFGERSKMILQSSFHKQEFSPFIQNLCMYHEGLCSEKVNGNVRELERNKNTYEMVPSITNYQKRCDSTSCVQDKPVPAITDKIEICKTLTTCIHDQNIEMIGEICSYSSIYNPPIPNKSIDNIDKKTTLESQFNRRSLKRSLSDSALELSNDNTSKDFNKITPNKRRKIMIEDSLLHSNVADEDFSNLINRRNSMSAVYSDENFFILINDDCVLEGESDMSNICYTQLPIELCNVPENCLEHLVYSASEKKCVEEQEMVHNKNQNVELINFPEKAIIEPWVDDVACIEDVACVETVFNDDVAEDVTISARVTPNRNDLNEDSTYNDDEREHITRLKDIYGYSMCTNDAQLVETLYKTPQMDVSKTLVEIESQNFNEETKHTFFDEEDNKVEEKENHLNLDNHESSDDELLEKNSIFSNKTTVDCMSQTYYEEDENNKLGNDICTQTRDLPHSDFSREYVGNNKFVDEKENHLILSNNHEYEEIIPKKIFNSSTTHVARDSNDCVIDSYAGVKTLTSIESDDYQCLNGLPSSPEVSSTTPEEKSSSLMLNIHNIDYNGSGVSNISNFPNNNSKLSYKLTEKTDYTTNCRPLITKAAQKYIPPLKITNGVKVKLPLPQHSLNKLKQLKIIKDESKSERSRQHVNNNYRHAVPKKVKPKFEDVLKSIDEIQFKKHKDNIKKTKHIPKVVIKKSKSGSHYASTPTRSCSYNPDLTGRKWQPWVFIERNEFVDKMALRNKAKAVYCHRRKLYVLAEKFNKYKSICTAKFVISQPDPNSLSSGNLKYTIKLKHNY
ncbi:unnamed protein product [Leptidea sinapis]|uniref:Uncharacterized protein n=1 Tax=Leptidea sinapis TaxID=189913 RepID=A0A5E4QDK6_9NEOP|nr:unnamed protein product [Leptidea sinapis]